VRYTLMTVIAFSIAQRWRKLTSWFVLFASLFVWGCDLASVEEESGAPLESSPASQSAGSSSRATASAMAPSASSSAAKAVKPDPSLLQYPGLATVPREERQAIMDTLSLIKTDGPFPHAQDGTTFQNRERNLPLKIRGYYREYTVPTPRVQTRGKRRLVIGNERETYYTRDHYNSFIDLKVAP
jgi:ribonuclease T1